MVEVEKKNEEEVKSTLHMFHIRNLKPTSDV